MTKSSQVPKALCLSNNEIHMIFFKQLSQTLILEVIS